MWKPKVLLTSSYMSEEAVKVLKEKCDVTVCKNSSRENLLKICKGFDGIVWNTHRVKVDREMLDAAGAQLKVLSIMAAGYNHVDFLEVKRRGILIGNTPYVACGAVADIGVGLMIAACRRFTECLQMVESGYVNYPELSGQDIRDSTLGIVGLGGIGQAIMKRLKPFDVAKFLYSGRSRKTPEQEQSAEFVSFDQLIQESDFVIAACPLTTETKEMFNESVFKKMKPTAVFVNVARGGIVAQDDLIKALNNGTIFAAGLDVVTPEPLTKDHPILMCKNAFVMPHIGGRTYRALTDMSKAAARNLLGGLFNKRMMYPVN